MKLYFDTGDGERITDSISSQDLAWEFYSLHDYREVWKSGLREENPPAHKNLAALLCNFIYKVIGGSFDADEFWSCYPFIRKELKFIERNKLYEHERELL